MLKLLINIWLLGSGRKCTEAKRVKGLRKIKGAPASWLAVHTEADRIGFHNSIPLGAGFWHRLKSLRTQGPSYQPHKRSKAEVEQIKKRSEALKRAKEFDEAARKGTGTWNVADENDKMGNKE